MTERLTQVICLYHGIALAAATFCEVSGRQLGQKLLLGICSEAFDMELMKTALCQEHLNFTRLLISVGDLCHAVNAPVGIECAHVEV